MCLLDEMLHWDRERIACATDSHRVADNPLRSRSGLQAACAIEYAAQAMALHGALVAPAGAGPQAGYLASVRGVKLAVARLKTGRGGRGAGPTGSGTGRNRASIAAATVCSCCQ